MIALSVRQPHTGFFDTAAVRKAVDATTRRVLSKFGAYVRTSARSLIRPGGKKGIVSRPDEPPRSHVGTLRKFIYFAWDPGRRSVVVGPEKTNQVFFGRNRRPVKGTIPQVLEHGGQITILEARWPHAARWQRADLRSRRQLARMQTRYRTAPIAPRPYMAPALKTNIGLLPAMWAGSIRRAA